MNVNLGTFAWAFAKSILRRICGPKNKTETREHCMTRSIMICILHQIFWRGQVKDNKMSTKQHRRQYFSVTTIRTSNLTL